MFYKIFFKFPKRVQRFIRQQLSTIEVQSPKWINCKYCEIKMLPDNIHIWINYKDDIYPFCNLHCAGNWCRETEERVIQDLEYALTEKMWR
jgi:REP element-mobilizing transposase RayT